MASMIYVEVYFIIIPLMTVLLSFVLPVSFVNKLVADVVLGVEKPLGKGATVMSLVAIITSFAFLFDFTAWQDSYQNPKKQFGDISLKLQHDTKRLRLERNLYIHMLACALCLSVKKIAALLRPRTVTAPVPSQANAPATKPHSS